MTINLDNYEQVFCMYVDDELSAADRERVESFLIQYPYLQEELDMLHQTKLSSEEISFFDKSVLLKPVISEELEHSLLLHLDNELDPSQIAVLEKEIAGNELVQKEWKLLSTSKLDASDKIEFPYKADLYKNEKGRVIRMPLLRWAAAAAVIGLSFYLGVSLLGANRDSADGTVATNGNVDTNNTGSKSATNATNVNVAQKENEAVTNETNTPSNQQYAANEVTEKSRSTKAMTSSAEIQEMARTKDNNKMIATAPGKKDENIGFIKQNDQPVRQYDEALQSNEIAALQPEKLRNSIELNEINQAPPVNRPIIDENIRSSGSAYAQTASLNFDENDNSVFLMEEDNISRSKAGIFLKKLKRNVERRANLKPGKSLRIAGFEFAVK